MDDKNRSTEQMPQNIGRYKVQESIGFGAMGAVYKAFDPLIKRTLAIKTIRLDIPRQSPQYKSFIERFYHEARISGTLSHPNIVTLFDIGEEGGVPYLAMEFVEGETLASLIEKGVRFKPEKVIGLASQIASAVDYAHGKGVIHRDIKPSNLILFDEERVKVTDFGIAKLVDAEMTQSGTLLGTPSYMSPEQAMGDKLDGRSDIFSLGVCCFEMLSGEQPFPGNNVTSILYKLVHVDPIEPANLEMNGLVPQKWHEVFGKVLAKKPDDRYQTAGAFVQDLEFCLGSWFGGLGAEQTLITQTPEGEGSATLPHIPLPDIQAASEGKEAGKSAPGPAGKPGTPPIPGPPPAEDSPATVIFKAPPPADDSPATVVLKTPPVAPPAKSRPPAPAPPAEDSPATVLMKAPAVSAPPARGRPPAPAEDSPATVLMKAPAVSAPPAKGRPPAPAEDSPATVLMKAPPASVPPAKGRPPAPAPEAEEAPATVLMKAPTAGPPPAKSRPPAPAPPAEEAPATVLMKAPVAGSSPAKSRMPAASEAEAAPATVLMKAGAPPKKSPPSGPPAAAPGHREPESTVLMEAQVEDPATVIMSGPAAGAKARERGGPKPPALEETRPFGKAASPPPPGSPSAQAPPVSSAPPRGPLRIPVALLVGGAAVLFLLAAAVVGIVLWRARAEPTPAPTVAPVTLAQKTESTPLPTPAPIVEKLGVIHVVSQPEGAAVSLNGEARGEAPLQLKDLPLGRYELKLELKGYETKTQVVVLTEELPAADAVIPLNRTAPPTGVADIVSTPYGAAVSIDGARVGATPLTDLKLRVGNRRVEMTKDGYEPWTGTLSVQAGKRGKVDAQLKALVKATPPPAAADTVDPNRIYANAPSEVDTLAKKVSGSYASYPDNAPKMKSGDSVSVSVSFVVTEKGEVTEPKVLESGGNKAVDEAVLAAFRNWKYAPAVKKGVKVKARVTLKQTFRAG